MSLLNTSFEVHRGELDGRILSLCTWIIGWRKNQCEILELMIGVSAWTDKMFAHSRTETFTIGLLQESIQPLQGYWLFSSLLFQLVVFWHFPLLKTTFFWTHTLQLVQDTLLGKCIRSHSWFLHSTKRGARMHTAMFDMLCSLCHPLQRNKSWESRSVRNQDCTFYHGELNERCIWWVELSQSAKKPQATLDALLNSNW